MRLDIDAGHWIGGTDDDQFPANIDTNTDTWPPVNAGVYVYCDRESIEEKLDRIIALLERLIKCSK